MDFEQFIKEAAALLDLQWRRFKKGGIKRRVERRITELGLPTFEDYPEAVFLTYPDAEILFNEESSLAVCDVIREHMPDIIVTHWNGSWHKDHQNCHLIVHDAIFYAALGTLERKLPPHSAGRTYYADNWEDASNFVPDTYIDIEAVYEKWIEACDFYPMWRGQTGFFRYNDYYSSLAVMRGCVSNFKRAVALMSDASQRVQRLPSL